MNYKRLFRHIVVRPRTRCWVWTGGSVAGYGRIGINGKSIGAHRVSYEQHVGPIPNGLFVLHRCDRRLCVNPDHLFLGTQQDNIRDCHAKGRAAKNLPSNVKGASNPFSKLTEEQVREILASNVRQVEIAAQYGVSQALISKIKRRESWTHIR